MPLLPLVPSALLLSVSLLAGCQPSTPLETKDQKAAMEAKKAKVSSTIEKFFKPHKTFGEYPAPQAPDYSNPDFWAALPNKVDEADYIIEGSGLQDRQATAKVDVFYIHPTTFGSKDGWNADPMSKLKMGKFQPIKMQGSIFNGHAKVYAPRYRQANVFAFSDTATVGQKPLELAGEDIRSAFEYYLKHYNQGRPFILAGHSQGTFHGVQILKHLDKYPNPLFIAAYLPGEIAKPSWFHTLKPCQNGTDLHCYNVWNTKRWGTIPEELTKSAIYDGSSCTNPLSWQTNEDVVTKEKHLGAINLDFKTFDRHVIEAAKCENQTLWIKISDDLNYHSRLDPNWYHMTDFNLFYLNVRENVKERIAAYQQKYGDK